MGRTTAIVACSALAGCNLVFGVDPGPTSTDALSSDAASADSGDTPDAPPPETCTYANVTRVSFEPSITPLHDFVVDDAGFGMVSAFVGVGSETVSRSASIKPGWSGWTHDPGLRDNVGGMSNVRLIPGDTAHMYATSANYLIHYELGQTGWDAIAMHPLQISERVGNMRTLAGKQVYVTTQQPTGGQATYLKLRSYDPVQGGWIEEDRMPGINTAQSPDLGVLTRDGLTLIYSARSGPSDDYDLFISTRVSLSDNFGLGVLIPGVNTNAHEVEPWIVGACDQLYFRRGASFFAGFAIVSEIWTATR